MVEQPKDYEVDDHAYERGVRDGEQRANQSWIMRMVWAIVGALGAMIMITVNYLLGRS